MIITEKLKIVTYNMRTLYSNPIDGECSFIHRAGLILETIRKEQPHVICFQEISDPIREFLNNYLNGYIVLGLGRLEDLKGEGLSIAYRKDCMEVFSFENFWLSPTPYVPASRYEIQSEYPRICPHIILKHKDSPRLMSIYDVHLDHISDQARILGIKQIAEKIIEDNNKGSYAVMVMGDFNALPESETIQYFKNFEEYKMIEVSGHIKGTFHNFFNKHEQPGIEEEHKIDYIFVDEETAKNVKSVVRWEHQENGIPLSDHYPLAMEVEI